MSGRGAGTGTGRADRARLATLRHELCTPLNAILGYSELLLEGLAGDAACVTDLGKIHTAGSELLARVNDLLDPARAAIERADRNPDAFAATVHHELRTPITAILGYSELLLEERAGDEASVADLGKIHAAAGRFLALIDDVARVAGRGPAGDDLPDEGTGAATPALLADAAAAIRALEEGADSAEMGGRGSILVVDDSDVNRDVLARQLARQGHRAIGVADGHTALELLRAQPFDLVLLDVMMPGLNGYEVLRRLKADADLRDLPVIMISALDELDSAVRCIALGATDYLPKPCNPVLLRARIGAGLEQKRLRDREVAYLSSVARVTAAASAVEVGGFDPASLDEVAGRTDALGQLARVFRRMAREVEAREARLRQEVQELRIEIDEGRQSRKVAEITESAYFQHLRGQASDLRRIIEGMGAAIAAPEDTAIDKPERPKEPIRNERRSR
jgi:CheY-like chemotaxis protein